MGVRHLVAEHTERACLVLDEGRGIQADRDRRHLGARGEVKRDVEVPALVDEPGRAALRAAAAHDQVKPGLVARVVDLREVHRQVRNDPRGVGRRGPGEVLIQRCIQVAGLVEPPPLQRPLGGGDRPLPRRRVHRPRRIEILDQRELAGLRRCPQQRPRGTVADRALQPQHRSIRRRRRQPTRWCATRDLSVSHQPGSHAVIIGLAHVGGGPTRGRGVGRPRAVCATGRRRPARLLLAPRPSGSAATAGLRDWRPTPRLKRACAEPQMSSGTTAPAPSTDSAWAPPRL